MYFFFVFKQKTAYEMRISDWSSDVCSSDLFDLTFGVTKVRNVAERDEVQAVAGRADFLVHLHPALQLRLVPVRQQYAVAGQFQMLGMLVKLVRDIGFIAERRREDREHQRGNETETDEKTERTNHEIGRAHV